MQKPQTIFLLLTISISAYGQNDFERPFLSNDNPDFLQARTLTSEADYEYEYIDEAKSPIADNIGRQETPPQNSLQRRPSPDCSSVRITIPHEEACDQFYVTTDCENEKAILRSCPNGLAYTGPDRFGLIDVCDYPHNVNCRGKKMKNPPISTEHCDWLYGIFGHETSCTRYWTCWNGTATEQFCVGGLLYNEETHACDWPQNVLGCQKHPLCKDDANGNVPLGKSCNRYWACQGGYPRLQRCPAMLVFDKIRKRCVSPPTADCDIPATTPAPVPHIGTDVSEGKQLKRSGGRRRNGVPQRNAPIAIVEANDEISNNLSESEAPFAVPQGATLISSPGDS